MQTYMYFNFVGLSYSTLAHFCSFVISSQKIMQTAAYLRQLCLYKPKSQWILFSALLHAICFFPIYFFTSLLLFKFKLLSVFVGFPFSVIDLLIQNTNCIPHPFFLPIALCLKLVYMPLLLFRWIRYVTRLDM